MSRRYAVLSIGTNSTRVLLAFHDSATEHFYVGDIRTAEGAPWAFCPRHVLRRAIERLQVETGLQLLASFEQELTYSGVPAHPWQPYELDALRRQGMFGEVLLAAMRQAGVIPAIDDLRAQVELRSQQQRLLIAQAQVENAAIVTDDSRIRKYDITTVW